MRDGTAPAVTEPACLPPARKAVQAAGSDDRLVLIHLPGANLRKPLAALQRLGWHPIIPGMVIPGTIIPRMISPGTAAPSPADDLTDAFAGLRNLIPDGAAIFGQIPHSDAAISALAGTRKILVVGELRGHLVACLQHELPDRKAGHAARLGRQEQMCRFLRVHGPALFGDLLAALTWATEPDVLVLRLEDFPFPPTVPDDHLLAALRPFRREGLETVAGRTIPATLARLGRFDQARPKAGSPVPLADIWSDEAERLFSAFGGCHLNQALGYDQPYIAPRHARPY